MTTTSIKQNNSEHHPLWQQQVELEAEMVSRGVSQAKANIAQAKAKKDESNTSYGSFLLRKAVLPVAEAIEQFKVTAAKGAGGRHLALKYLAQVDPKVAAVLALRTCLNMVSSRFSLQSAAIHLADQVETEVRLDALEKSNKNAYQTAERITKHSSHEYYKRNVFSFIANKEGFVWSPWPKSDKLHLGIKLIELIVDTTGYVEIVADTHKRGPGTAKLYYLVGTSKCLEWITRRENLCELFTPEFLPCIMPPKPWTSPFSGGYYTHARPLNLVKTAYGNYLEELANEVDAMPVVYEAVNAMQNTAYQVNKKVLEVMEGLWDSGGGRAGIPEKANRELPRCPVCGSEVIGHKFTRNVKHACFDDPQHKEQLSAWKRQAKKVYEYNIQTLSKRFQFAKILWVANKFAEHTDVYFPMQLDFRGRVYAVPSYLNPQGSDPAKGLLLFSQGKALTSKAGEQWLAVHGANMYGNDKVSLAERQQWVADNEKMILSVADNPYDNRWWQDADKPWQFLAFCFEWAAYKDCLKRGETFISSLPVAMDGTCNGLQIFSLMLRDPVGAAAVNVIPSDTPQDIYQVVADKVTAKLQDKKIQGLAITRPDKNSESGEETAYYDEREVADLLLQIGISRKTTKRQVMVLPYGGTFQSCREYTLSWLQEQAEGYPGNALFQDDQPLLYPASHFLATLIWEAISETIEAAPIAMSFLQKLASLAASEMLPVNWRTPVGFRVLQAYPNVKERRVKPRIGSEVIYLTLKEDINDGSVDKRRQRNGISPNFVHSLDAAALMLSIHYAAQAQVHSFSMVHDSYAVPAADAPTMAQCLRKAFVDCFGATDVLAQLRDEVGAMLTPKNYEKLPPLPEKGSLDISLVTQSAYFFA